MVKRTMGRKGFLPNLPEDQAWINDIAGETASSFLVKDGKIAGLRANLPGVPHEPGTTTFKDTSMIGEYVRELKEAGDDEEKKRLIIEKYVDHPVEGPGRDFPGYVVDSDRQSLMPEEHVRNQVAEILAPLSREDKVTVIKEVQKEFADQDRYDRVMRKLDSHRSQLTPELREMELDILRRNRELTGLKEELLVRLVPFMEFCKAIRGYDEPKHRGEPGAHLMALGRIFAGQEDVKLEELSELLESVEIALKHIGKLTHLAPNAEQGYRYLDSMFEKASGNWLVHFSRSWARDGFPTVELPHKTAAALMFTDGDPAIMVDPPWRGFVVKVPDGIVWAPTMNVTLGRILAWYAPEEVTMRWWLMLQFRCDDGWKEVAYGLKSLDVSEKELRAATAQAVMDNAQLGIGTLTHIDEQTKIVLLAARLVAGCCMMVSAKENVSEQTWEPKPSKTKNRPPGVEPPEGTRFIIGKNVEIDLRPHVKEFVASGKSRKGVKLSVQVPVRGHRRNQAWGPKHTLRKEIWIQPHWKGPLTGEALFRGYEIKPLDAGPQPPQEEPATADPIADAAEPGPDLDKA